MNRLRTVGEWRRGRLALQSASVLSRASLSADAISRAYYAILHATRAALLTRSITPNNHHAAGDLLNRHFIYPGDMEREWLDVFRNAMLLRVEADYNALAVFTYQQADDSYRQAEAFCARIHRHLLAEGFSDAELATGRP